MNEVGRLVSYGLAALALFAGWSLVWDGLQRQHGNPFQVFLGGLVFGGGLGFLTGRLAQRWRRKRAGSSVLGPPHGEAVKDAEPCRICKSAAVLQLCKGCGFRLCRLCWDAHATGNAHPGSGYECRKP